MSIYCSSQNSYPKKIVFENDTCVAISIEQLHSLNLKLEHKQFLENKIGIINKQNQEYSRLLYDYRQQVIARDSLILGYKQTAKESEQFILKELEQKKLLEKKMINRKIQVQIMYAIIATLSLLALIQN